MYFKLEVSIPNFVVEFQISIFDTFDIYDILNLNFEFPFQILFLSLKFENQFVIPILKFNSKFLFNFISIKYFMKKGT